MKNDLDDTKAKRTNLEVYGSFYLNGIEFAIGMADLQEVVNAPTNLQTMPLSPNYLLGLFNLRGRILPVIDLHVLLKMEKSAVESPASPRMVVLRRGAAYLGLLFDAVGEILRVKQEELAPISQRNISEGVPAIPVSAVICRAGGERIIQVLDLTVLLAIQNLPLIDRMTDPLDSNHTLTSRMKDLYREKLVGFFIAGCNLALEMKAIVAIIPSKEKKISPYHTALCKSAISFHGQLIPVVDCASLLQIETTGNANHILVCRVGDGYVGFEVDGITSIIPYAKNRIVPIPVLQEHRSSVFKGCFTDRDGKDFIVLNDEGLLSKAEIVSLQSGHTLLASGEQKTLAAAPAQISLITFRMGKLYGVRLLDVVEVLKCPKELTRAPNMPLSVLGILNLRGNPIPVIDPRQLFEMDATTEHTEWKLLVFRHENREIAMRVDSVEGILSIPDSGKEDLPSVIFKSASTGLKKTIEKGVHLTSSGQNSVLLILSSNQIARALTEALAA